MLRPLKLVRWQKTWLTITVIGSAAIWLWMNIIQQWNAPKPVVPTNRVGVTMRTFGPDPATLEPEFEETLTLLRPATSSTPFSTQSIARVKHFLEAIDNGVSSRWKNTPVQLERHHETQVWLALVRGGRPVSRLESHRSGVADFVSRSGAVAGINGGFFVDASLKGTNNFMIGPVMTEVSNLFQPERNREILERVQSRPLVIWGTQRLAILPFNAEAMNSPELLRAFMPDLKNVFLGGAWILRHGQAVTESELEQSGPRDANDVRPQVFLA
jgi:hypothetical protein